MEYLIGGRQRFILLFCATFLLVFGFMSIVDAEISSIYSKEWDADNKTISIIDPDNKAELMSVRLVSSVSDLTTFTEIFEISNYYAYQPDSKNDFRTRTEVFQGNEDVSSVEWFIEQNVSCVVNVTDYCIKQVEKEIYNNKTGKNETILVDITVIAGYHDETRYKDVWVDYQPYDKVMSKDRVQRIKVIYYKVPELGPFHIQTIPMFRGVECPELTWWSGSWDRRRAILINNTAGDAVTDYQLKSVNLLSYNIDAISTRIINETSGLEENFWNESVNANGNLEYVWCNFSNLSSGGWINSTYYIYYQSTPTVSSVSDIEDTMIFGDDFPGSSLDTNKWTLTGTIPVSNSIATIGTGSEKIVSVNTFSSAITEFRIKWPPSGTGDPRSGFADAAQSRRCYAGQYLNYFHLLDASGNNLVSTNNWLDNIWETIQISRDVSIPKAWWYENGAEATNSPSTTNVPTEDINLYFSTSENAVMCLDWVIVRKYTTDEPEYWTVGAEEEYSLGDVNITLCTMDLILDSSVVVSWHTSNNSNSRMYYGTNGPDTANFTNGNWSVWVYNQTNISIHQYGLSDNTEHFWAPYSESMSGNVSGDEFLLQFKTPVSSVPGGDNMELGQYILLVTLLFLSMKLGKNVLFALASVLYVVHLLVYVTVGESMVMTGFYILLMSYFVLNFVTGGKK